MVSPAPVPNPEFVDRLLTIISKEGVIERDKLTMDAPLDTLGVVSADVVVILLAVEEEFGVYIPVDGELSDVQTVGDLVVALSRKIETQQSAN